MVGSAAIKQGRSANRKHTYFFFWPNQSHSKHLSAQFQCLTFLPSPKGQGCAYGKTFYLHDVLNFFPCKLICNIAFRKKNVLTFRPLPGIKGA